MGLQKPTRRDGGKELRASRGTPATPERRAQTLVPASTAAAARATAVASKNFGFCVPHSRTALVNVKSRKSSAVMQCSAADEMGALSAIVAVIDRYAFWCSVFVGIAGWVYIDSRRVPA